MKTSIKARKKTEQKIKGYLNMVLLGQKILPRLCNFMVL